MLWLLVRASVIYNEVRKVNSVHSRIFCGADLQKAERGRRRERIAPAGRAKAAALHF